jgi:hypothetical protein
MSGSTQHGGTFRKGRGRPGPLGVGGAARSASDVRGISDAYPADLLACRWRHHGGIAAVRFYPPVAEDRALPGGGIEKVHCLSLVLESVSRSLCNTGKSTSGSWFGGDGYVEK